MAIFPLSSEFPRPHEYRVSATSSCTRYHAFSYSIFCQKRQGTIFNRIGRVRYLSTTQLYGMERDIGISDDQYNIALMIFFFSYALFEVSRFHKLFHKQKK